MKSASRPSPRRLVLITSYLVLFPCPDCFLLLCRWVRSARGRWRCSRRSSAPAACCWSAWPCPPTTGCWWRRASCCSRTRPPRWRWRCTRACGGSASWQVGTATTSRYDLLLHPVATANQLPPSKPYPLHPLLSHQLQLKMSQQVVVEELRTMTKINITADLHLK